MLPDEIQQAFCGKRVWLSGHTGFKGSWLAHWLVELGAEVFGFSLEAGEAPVHHRVGDVRDAAAVRASIEEAQPDFVFHLAAQAIVRTGYDVPVDTWAVNTLGTIHVLEALRGLRRPCAAVFVTTDKCYENAGMQRAFREGDALGGDDPYSSSKAAAEIAIASWRRSFFDGQAVRIASARAGNVIGGGDYGAGRIVPDCIRALRNGETIAVRSKDSVRPWQFVLEPLSGYLTLAAALSRDAGVAGGYNFGPGAEANRTVAELVREILRHWPGSWAARPGGLQEARFLSLDTGKAARVLGWRPVWTFEQAVAATVAGYRADDFPAMATQQIARYMADWRSSIVPVDVHGEVRRCYAA